MSKNSIVTSAEKHEKISAKLEQVSLNSIRKVLPDSMITRICDDIGYQYRERIMTPIVTVLHMIMAAIWPEDSFNASWQILWSAMTSKFPQLAGLSPSAATVSKARSRLPVKLWHKLLDYISRKGQELSESHDTWHGHRVVLADGTCVSMSDEQDLHDEFGTCTGRYGASKYPLARMVTLCLCNTMIILDYNLGRYRDDENALLAPLLKKLRKGDLLVADRHFAAAHFYWFYQSLGLEFLTRAHQNLKMSRIKRLWSYSQNDFVGWLNINPIYRKKNSDLPERIMVRFTQYIVRIRGQRKVVWLAGSLLDEAVYPANEIIQLYGKRWRIETLLQCLKINASADVLRSKSSAAIRKELAARVIAVNLIRMIMLESAVVNNVDPIRISFVGAVRAILSFAPSLAIEPLWKLPQIYNAMLVEIASNVVPWRPGRIEPRAVTRENKHYPRLKTTRAEWRKSYAA